MECKVFKKVNVFCLTDVHPYSFLLCKIGRKIYLQRTLLGVYTAVLQHLFSKNHELCKIHDHNNTEEEITKHKQNYGRSPKFH